MNKRKEKEVVNNERSIRHLDRKSGKQRTKNTVNNLTNNSSSKNHWLSQVVWRK